MHLRIAVDLGGGGLQHAGLHPLCQAQAVDGAHHGGLHRLDGIVLVMRRRGRAGEVVDLVDLDLEGIDHVVPQEFKARVGEQVDDVLLPAGEQIVEADDLVPVADEPVAEVTAQEAGAAGDEDSHVLGWGVPIGDRCRQDKSGDERSQRGRLGENLKPKIKNQGLSRPPS